ncbi:MAG TPA: leucine--tRNA ligase [Candidatus Thermoplasmatota archaeon]|nr:leucine--tRNA ligase [Candidatus Thermoplasmatota archaeon]
MAEDAWDLEAITAKWQARWWAAKVQHAERPTDWIGTVPGSGVAKPTFFIHFAYPGISGFLHVGHMRGFTYTDVFARYKRMTGHHVLFPAGFHASGIPAVAFASEVKRGEKTEYLRTNGYEGPIEALSDPKAVVGYFARIYTNDYWKKFGFLIDERRNCTTIDPAYNRFIQWQFRALSAKGYLIQKPHYAPYCPVAGPVAVDKSETDIKQGGSAEVLEFVALRFTLPAGTVHAEPVILPCATLRPETVYGCTNVWVHPDQEYHLVRVWQDGFVKDSDPSEVWAVSARGVVKLEWQFERAKSLHIKVDGRTLVGENVVAPVTGKRVPVVAGSFVDPQIATGVVMSVPGHAPFDYAAYKDAGLLDTLGAPPVIVTVEGQKGIPAAEACRRHKVTNQGDRAQLDAATEELYSDEFNKGVLTEACGPYAGKRIKAVKDQIKADFISVASAAPLKGHFPAGRILRQFSEPVVSRAGEMVDIKRVPDQDFIHYADKPWTEKAKAHAASMAVFPQRYKDELPNVLDWFGDRACVRRGAWLGTEFPFKPGWIVEPIADSTFYSWFYLVQRYVRSEWNPSPPRGGLAVEELTDAFFEFVFNGRGSPAKPLWEEVRKDVLFWGPVDINLGGKEHQTVHFPVYVMNNVALMEDPRLWPKGIFVNWWVTQKAGAKISKSKGGAEPIPGAARRYGVDAMRLYYCHVGSPHVDIEWDPDLVMSYKVRVERVARLCDEALAATGPAGPMDAWLEAAFAKALGAARSAYEAHDLRTAATELVYTVPDLLRWYHRRGGSNGALLRRAVREWAQGLCPMLPHLAEEMHERAGGKGLCTASAFPDLPEPGPAALASEEYLRAVLEDMLTVRKLAGIERPESLALYTTAAWKRRLLAQAAAMAAAAGGKFPMGQFMQQVMADPTMREQGKAVQAFTGKLPQAVTQTAPWQRILLEAGTDERQVLQEAAPFLARELGVPAVQVFSADDPQAPDHPKKGLAAPFKPGIAIA